MISIPYIYIHLSIHLSHPFYPIWMIFQAKEDIELWASLEIEGPTANAWYGRGLYTVPLPPDGWEDIHALLATWWNGLAAGDGWSEASFSHAMSILIGISWGFYGHFETYFFGGDRIEIPLSQWGDMMGIFVNGIHSQLDMCYGQTWVHCPYWGMEINPWVGFIYIHSKDSDYGMDDHTVPHMPWLVGDFQRRFTDKGW